MLVVFRLTSCKRGPSRLIGDSVVYGQLDPLALRRDVAPFCVLDCFKALFILLPMNPVTVPLTGNSIDMMISVLTPYRFVRNFLPRTIFGMIYHQSEFNKRVLPF
ncbi:hypothetical protein EVAR_31645_1 [Eumeta japonica]|uniref:Uncharacterized protein n=1 Tax=Eumeta variegata TaxID=151549 RepID=A0A4C1VZE5_EUMVA|nr:hypothetical protein EVAR_31645_1 [Eumeta japonica]